MILLALDASTYTGTVAVLSRGAIVAHTSAAMRGRDAERLMPAVDEALRLGGVSVARLEGVVCGSGPGSFTSLRIAASIAKGLAAGRGIPLFAVSSLALMVGANATMDGRYLAALDALRGECYAEAFELKDRRLHQVARGIRARNDALLPLAGELGARLVGPDQADKWNPDAAGVLPLLHSIEKENPVNISLWEPDYGRQPEAQAKWEAAHGKPLRQ